MNNTDSPNTPVTLVTNSGIFEYPNRAASLRGNGGVPVPQIGPNTFRDSRGNIFRNITVNGVPMDVIMANGAGATNHGAPPL